MELKYKLKFKKYKNIKIFYTYRKCTPQDKVKKKIEIQPKVAILVIALNRNIFVLKITEKFMLAKLCVRFYNYKSLILQSKNGNL